MLCLFLARRCRARRGVSRCAKPKFPPSFEGRNFANNLTSTGCARLPILLIGRPRRFGGPFGGGEGVAAEVPAEAAPAGIGGSGGLREGFHGS
eukprot:3890008-Pyramimonas_sp.AAC.1